VSLIEVNGVNLWLEQAGEGKPLLLLHGFTGSHSTWEPFVSNLSVKYRLLMPDLVGHGQSDAPADPERYSIERCVDDLLAMLDRLDIGGFDLLGYSMGGRVALHLALAAPERVRRLVLESASPGIDDPAERAARVASDETLAQRIEQEGLEAFIDYWERIPLFASQERLPEATRQRLRAQRLSNPPTGLANSLRGMGAGAMTPVWSRLGELTMPALLMAGELDEKYVGLTRVMAEAIPAASVHIVLNAGHATHLEAPAPFIEAVTAFLDCDPESGEG